MDPNACLIMLVAALDAGDDDDAREHADDLAHWLGRGGFPPDWAACGMTREAFEDYRAEIADRPYNWEPAL